MGAMNIAPPAPDPPPNPIPVYVTLPPSKDPRITAQTDKRNLPGIPGPT